MTLEYYCLDFLQIVSTLLWSKVQLVAVVVDFEYEQQLLKIESCEGVLGIFEQIQVLSVQNLGKSPCSLLVIQGCKYVHVLDECSCAPFLIGFVLLELTVVVCNHLQLDSVNLVNVVPLTKTSMLMIL